MTPITSRRDFVRAATASVAASAWVANSPYAGATAAAGRKPNVILIILDDLGSIDLNCYGAKDLVTPNLDALAASGVRLTGFCSASPVCSPSRAGTLTGRFPHRAGLPNNAASQPGGAGMPADEITMAQMFKAAGYATGHAGKWHLGYAPNIMPNARGFDTSFGHMGGCIDNYSHFFYWDGPNRHDLWENGTETFHEGEHIGDMTVAHCESFIEKHKDEPFFLYWAINQPHYPLQGRAKWREHYKNLASPRNMYAASVSSLDEMVGQVVAKVKALGLLENTIIIAQSDHGHSTEDRAFGGGGNAGPYRGAKFSMFEGGFRVVGMISHVGTLPANQVRDQFVTGCDWMPTLAEMTGVDLPKRRIDGKSITSILKSADAKSPHDVWHWQLGQQWAVREGTWKLIGNPSDTSKKGPVGKYFLSDLSKDVSEMTDVSHQEPERMKRMIALHEQWVKDVKDRS